MYVRPEFSHIFTVEEAHPDESEAQVEVEVFVLVVLVELPPDQQVEDEEGQDVEAEELETGQEQSEGYRISHQLPNY